MLPIISWLPATATGDVAENSGFQGGMESELWARISTQRDECLGPRCRFARNCFVRKARALALQSDVVVANHATVFWEAGEPSVALPPFRCIVFDEAHNLEDVATDAATIQVARWQLLRVLNRLFRAQSDGAGRGLLANLRHQLSLASSGMPAAWPTSCPRRSGFHRVVPRNAPGGGIALRRPGGAFHASGSAVGENPL